MYNVKIIEDQKYQVYMLEDTETNSWIKVAPERGGIIFSYGVNGDELFYLNEETFYDTEKNIRGGNPILFPISGQLTGGAYEWNGKTYIMKNHGFARDASWQVLKSDTDNRAALTLKLTSNEQTKDSYPFDFEVIFIYVLEKGKLTIQQEYHNKGSESMPIYPGFHPYFKMNEKNLSYYTDATKYYDYNDNEVKEFIGTVDITNLKESVVFLDAKQTNISFPIGEKRIKLEYGKEFKYIVLWTESGKEFICVEPWMALTDEFNRKEELVMINGQDTLKTEFSIKIEE